ncbi:hypothetical protein [Pseudomonas sp. NPDC087690]|uniref:hypothetical protein n=1 Tax=Pseudomonas sp. NPDC087690 TaxID=3364446 RepID=UPI0038145272
MDDNKKKALAAALGQIERQFGKGAVMRMGDQDRQAIPAISTGSLGLDIALGIGGLPKGRIVEIYGPESSGKTTLTLSVIAQAQKAGAVKEGDEVVGSETRVKVVKNKVASPFRQAEFQILYGKGIYLNGEMIDLGVLHGFVEKSGAWYAYEGTKIGQGKANSAKFLADNPEIAAKLEKQLRDKLLTPAVIDSKASAVKETEDDLADADI